METQKENLNVYGTEERQEIAFKKKSKGNKSRSIKRILKQKEIREINRKNKTQGQQTDLRNVIGEGTNERQEITKIDIKGKKFKHTETTF